MNKPELKEGEIYVGAIIGADSRGAAIKTTATITTRYAHTLSVECNLLWRDKE